MDIFNDQSLIEIREYCLKRNIPLLSLNLAKILYSLVKISNPKKILEIGTAVGYSAIVIGKALNSFWKIHTFEISIPSYQKALINIEENLMQEQITVINNNFLEVANDFLVQEKYFDLYFIDGRAKNYLDYFQKIESYLQNGNTVLFDNVIKFKYKMENLYEYLQKKDYNYTIIIDYEKDDGMLLLFI